MRPLRLVMLAILSALTLQCGHTLKTPAERRCAKRIEACLKRCVDPPGYADPYEPPPSGCGGGMSTECEDQCHRLCT
ncbi:MAG: hypothetical protein OXT09_36910 [Myxococcales bacterium]|nr:hypothetical protein [Myxococcales bacterium]